MYKIIFLLLVGVTVANAFACTKNYCDSVTCTTPDCKEGQTLEQHASACGCCAECITYLGKGDKCPPPVSGGPPPTTKCEDGLSCQRDENRDLRCT
ncbi:uncharacterized protein CDAR_48051 [Caerostris darwini]|uniref:Uncharacterized protein n=1 Tax=Caerostris darwini TaxID=1538125 RepID=A0AAV4W4G2_9ARAC|nr:uncharacterized protein CDAR_48051 [Caerostris darwini]